MPAFDYSKPHSNSHIATESEWGDFMRYAVPSGVVFDAVTSCQVYGDSSGKQVKVRAGACFVDGVNAENTSQKTVTLEDNTSGNPRIDRIVGRLDRTTNTVEVTYIKGTPGATPVAPAITNSATVVDITLAKVAIANGYSTVAAGDVTDERQIATGLDGQSGNTILLYDNELTGTAATWSIPDIPQTFRDLKLVVTGRSDQAATNSQVYMRPNGVSAAEYDWERMVEANEAQTYGESLNTSYARIGTIAGNTAAASKFGSVEATIWRYQDIEGRKYLANSVYQGASTEVSLERVYGIFETGYPVTSMTVGIVAGSTNFVAGSSCTLYGIR